MTNPSCPVCGADRIHRSRRRNWLDRGMALLGAGPCRCHQCNARFVRLGGSLLRTCDVNRLTQRLAIFLMMMTAAAAILAGIVWFSHKAASFNPAESRAVAPVCEVLET